MRITAQKQAFVELHIMDDVVQKQVEMFCWQYNESPTSVPQGALALFEEVEKYLNTYKFTSQKQKHPPMMHQRQQDHSCVQHTTTTTPELNLVSDADDTDVLHVPLQKNSHFPLHHTTCHRHENLRFTSGIPVHAS